MTSNLNLNRRGGNGGKISKRSIKSRGLNNSSTSTFPSISKVIPDVNINEVNEIRNNVNDLNDAQLTNLQSSTSDTTHDHSPAAASVRRPLITEESDDDFQSVVNKNSKRKQTQTALQFHQITDTNRSVINTVIPILSSDITASINNDLHSAGNNQIRPPIQPFTVTNESTRFSLTRYPFPPFVVHFKSTEVTVNQVKDGLINQCTMKFQTDINIINCRTNNSSLRNNECDFLIFTEDAVSFSFLFDRTHWPNVLGNESYDISSFPSIPPQLCLLVKNVDLNVDFNEFCDEIKNKFPAVKNIIRMKNKFQQDIKMIKLELISSAIHDDLLHDRKININNISYDIIEYLAPANVLICSKCMALGHFEKECTQVKETCRTCGDLVDDIKNHHCSNIDKCTNVCQALLS
jgi:hypothetical protein